MAVEKITYPSGLPRDVWTIILAAVLVNDLANNSGDLLSLSETCRRFCQLVERMDKRELFKRLGAKQLQHLRPTLQAWQETQKSYIFFPSYAAKSLIDVFDLCQFVFDSHNVTPADKFTFITRLKQILLHNSARVLVDDLSSREHLEQATSLKLPKTRASLQAICSDEAAHDRLQDVFERFITALYLAEGKRPNGSPGLPYDVLRNILTWLEKPKDVLAFALTCKTFYHAYITSDNCTRYFAQMSHVIMIDFLHIQYGVLDLRFSGVPLIIFEACAQLSLLQCSNTEKKQWFEAMHHAIQNQVPVTTNHPLLSHALKELLDAEKAMLKSRAYSDTVAFTKTLLELFLALSNFSDNISRNKTALRYYRLLREHLNSMQKFQNTDHFLHDIQNSPLTTAAEIFLAPFFSVFFNLSDLVGAAREIRNIISSTFIPGISFWRRNNTRATLQEHTPDLSVLNRLPEIKFPQPGNLKSSSLG